MQYSSLVGFITGEVSAEKFAAEISAEVRTYDLALQKQGGVNPIFLTDGPPKIVTREEAVRLLSAVADQRISPVAANYVADGVIMSDHFNFADDAVAEAFHVLADDSSELTQADVSAALASMVG